MAEQPGVVDLDDRYAALSTGRSARAASLVVDFKLFRGELDAALGAGVRFSRELMINAA
jgi:hypothetical protein